MFHQLESSTKKERVSNQFFSLKRIKRMGFKQTVMMVMGVLLFLSLGLVGYTLYKARNAGTSNNIVPGECPDYWVSHTSEDGTMMCVNEKDLGTCTSTNPDQTHLSIDFASMYPDSCSKYTWAQNCGISWDGITYGVPNPCDS